jgi:nucleoside-diphosphate-sugar epimerase
MLSHLNVGSGTDISIGELAQLVARVTGYKGRIENDLMRPDGTMRKLMCSDKLMAMGWQPQVDLERGVAETYRWFLENRLD